MCYDLKKEFKVPATGVVEYQYFSVDPGFKEDKWIKAIEARLSESGRSFSTSSSSHSRGGSHDEGRPGGS